MRFTKRCGRGVALIVLAGSAVALVPTSAPAETLSTFDARAAASGVDVTASNASIPLGLVVQGTAPVARAALDSLGTSQALAAGPYPGDLAASLPGTVKTTSGIPLPDYPLMAATSFGDEPKEVVAPGMSLRAESRASRSTSRATVGTDSSGSTSTAAAERDDAGGVQALAVSRFDVLRVLNRLTLSGVVAEASTVMDELGTRTSKSSLRIDAIDAAGLVVSVPETTPKGGLPDMPPLVSGQPAPPQPPPSEPTKLPGGGTTVAGPVLRFADGKFSVVSGAGDKATEVPVPAAAVIEAFHKLGIEMTYQAAQTTDTGVVAPVLSFRTTLPALPDNPTAFQGPTAVTVDVGRVTTSVAGRATSADGAGFDPTAGLPSPVGSDAGFESSSPATDLGTADVDTGIAASDGGNGFGFDSGALSGGGGFAADPDSGSTAAPSPAEEAAVAAPQLAGSVGRTVNARKVYFVFAVLAGVGLIAGSLVRTVGVKVR